MEALSDGIFAIAMTLLVLELKVPDLPKSAGASELLHKIGEEGPAFFSFLVSFLYCGLLWMMLSVFEPVRLKVSAPSKVPAKVRK